MSRPAVAAAYRREAQAALTALTAGVVAGVLMIVVGSGWTQGYGIFYALAGSLGAITGLLAYVLHPRPFWGSDTSGRMVAELSRRGPTSFAKKWIFMLPFSSAVALVLGLLLTGLYSTTDENGLHRMFQRRALSGWGIDQGQVVDVQYNLSTSGPFPGWYYGVPVIIGTILFMGVVYWALRRIATAPRPMSATLFAADTSLRSLATRFIMTTSSAALAVQIAGLAFITGNVLRFAHLDSVPTADITDAAGSVPVEPGHTLAIILILASLVIAILATLLLTSAIGTIRKMWSISTWTDLRIHEPVQ